jgi:hypothetical protein
MSEDKIFQEGVDYFISEKWKTPMHALANYPYPLTKIQRFKFAEGFKHARNIFTK